MVSEIKTTSLPAKVFGFPIDPKKAKNWGYTALAAIFAVGMILSYTVGAPWLVIFGFFGLSLLSLCPLRKKVDEQRQVFLS